MASWRSLHSFHENDADTHPPVDLHEEDWVNWTVEGDRRGPLSTSGFPTSDAEAFSTFSDRRRRRVEFNPRVHRFQASLRSRGGSIPVEQAESMFKELLIGIDAEAEGDARKHGLVQAYSSYLQFLSRVGDLGRICARYGELKEVGLYPRPFVFKSMIRGCRNHGEKGAGLAVMWFEDMKRHGFVPSTETFVELLGVIANNGNLPMLNHYFSEMMDAIEVLTERGDAKGLHSYNDAVNVILTGCVHHKELQPLAESLFTSMKTAGEESVPLFNHMLRMHEAKLDPDGACAVFEDIVLCGLFPDEVSIRTLCWTCAQDPNGVKRVEDLFTLMRQNNMYPGEIGFTELMRVLVYPCKDPTAPPSPLSEAIPPLARFAEVRRLMSDYSSDLKRFHRHPSSSIPPDWFHFLLEICKSLAPSDACTMGEATFREAMSRKAADERTYTMLLNLFIANEKFDSMKRVHDEVSKLGLIPLSEHTLSVLLKGCRLHGRPAMKRACDWFDQFMAETGVHSRKIFFQIVNLLFHNNELHLAREKVRVMLRANIAPDPVFVNLMKRLSMHDELAVIRKGRRRRRSSTFHPEQDDVSWNPRTDRFAR